jgi:hypothetical protein
MPTYLIRDEVGNSVERCHVLFIAKKKAERINGTCQRIFYWVYVDGEKIAECLEEHDARLMVRRYLRNGADADFCEERRLC